MRTDIKVALAKHNKTQAWLNRELFNRGVVVNPPQLSGMISGTIHQPRAKVVLREAEKILAELEEN